MTHEFIVVSHYDMKYVQNDAKGHRIKVMAVRREEISFVRMMK